MAYRPRTDFTDMADSALLTPAEVAQLFRVDPKTVSRWARDGKLNHFRTPGGHTRYRYGDMKALLAKGMTS